MKDWDEIQCEELPPEYCALCEEELDNCCCPAEMEKREKVKSEDFEDDDIPF